MFLSELKDAQSGVISSINADAAFTRRLGEMGFTAGERVECICRSAFGSPILYFAKGSAVALRKRDASRVAVTI
ncbi:MAG: ferrous iron transport protein A [Eubacterium sp.]|nr:ferrous iron transport protein A [Eubacterium sp.]